MYPELLRRKSLLGDIKNRPVGATSKLDPGECYTK